MRPVLKPALRRVWRDRTTLQLGVGPTRALVLEDVGRDALALLDLLDGTRDCAGVVAAAARLGVLPEAVRCALDRLAAAGALDDAGADTAPLADLCRDDRERLVPELAALSLEHPAPGAGLAALGRRRRASVLVVGAGRIGALSASLLGAAGVGRVVIDDVHAAVAADSVPGGLAGADAGLPRARAAVQAVRRAAGEACTAADSTRQGSTNPADYAGHDLVLLAPEVYLGPHPRQLAAISRARVASLLVGVRDGTGVVGPLALPGLSSCPRCHDLHRADRDLAWPAVAAQLATPAAGAVQACSVALASMLAGVAVAQALAHLDQVVGRDRRLAGRHPTAAVAVVDATLEMTPPDWRLRRRSWAPHPGCGCILSPGRPPSPEQPAPAAAPLPSSDAVMTLPVRAAALAGTTAAAAAG